MRPYKTILLLNIIHVFMTSVSSVNLDCYYGSYKMVSLVESVRVNVGSGSTCSWIITPTKDYFWNLSIKEIELPLDRYCSPSLNIYNENGQIVKQLSGSNFGGTNSMSGLGLFKKVNVQLSMPHCHRRYNNWATLKIKQHELYGENCDTKASKTGVSTPLVIYRPGDLLSVDGKDEQPTRGLYVKEMVHSGPASTFCHLGQIILPKTDTPSCHAANASSCEWIPHSGITNVTERSDLNGGQFKVSSDTAEFRSKSTSLQIKKVCLYIEYVNGPTESTINQEENPITAVVKTLSTETNSSVELVHKVLKRVNEWTVVRITEDVVQSERSQYQLVVELTNARGIFINKLYGCDPYRERARTILEGNLNLNYIPKAEHSVVSTSSCQNGGIMKEDRCDCPFGFTGEKCEIGCGKDRWGTNCEEECSSTENGCRYNVFCVGDQCLCSSGYTGETCQNECSAGRYGAGCNLRCGKCSSGAHCDPFTGHCPTPCQPGYIQPQCHHKYVQLAVSPNVTEISYAGAKVSAILGSNTVGQGIPLYFITQLKGEDGLWRSLNFGPIVNGKITDELSGLKPGTAYQVRLILKTNHDNDYEEENIKPASFNTTCTENNTIEMLRPTAFNNGTIRVQWKVEAADWRSCPLDEIEVEVTSGTRWMTLRTKASHNSVNLRHLLRDTYYIFRARPLTSQGYGPFSNVQEFLLDKGRGVILNLKTRNVTSRSAVISWDYTPHKASTFNLTYQCVKILAGGDCLDDRGSLRVEGKWWSLVEGLSPHRKYQITLHKISTNGSAGLVLTTPPQLPEVGPRLGEIKLRNTSAELVLLPPEDCSLCNGYLTGYMLTDPEANVNVTIGFNKKEALKYEDLKPMTGYSVQVFLVNTVGWSSNHYLVLEFNTTGSVPSEVRELSVYKQGRSLVGLRWSSPIEIYGELESFTVQYLDKAITEPPTPCNSWPESYCFTATGLKPDTVYNFSVSAKNKEFNEIGPRSFVIATTSEKAPDAPENLRVVDTWDTGLKVEWNPPMYANGLIRTFLVKIDQIESYTDEICCHSFPKREIIVKEEKEFYSVELSDLRPGSEYAVSVMAETVWYGPAAKLYANTTLNNQTQSPLTNQSLQP